MSLPSRNFLAASVALGALAAGIAFLLYRCPLLLLMSWGWKGKQLWIVWRSRNQWEWFQGVSQCCALGSCRNIFIDSQPKDSAVEHCNGASLLTLLGVLLANSISLKWNCVYVKLVKLDGCEIISCWWGLVHFLLKHLPGLFQGEWDLTYKHNDRKYNNIDFDWTMVLGSLMEGGRPQVLKSSNAS